MLNFYTYVQTLFADRLRREEGQTMAEYAVVLAVITLIVIGAIGILSGAISDKLGEVSDILGGAGN